MGKRRSENKYDGIDFGMSDIITWDFKRMWDEGWLDDYSDNHFLIRAIHGDDKIYYNVCAYCKTALGLNNIQKNFAEMFCVNFITKFQQMIRLFGEKTMKDFVKNQLAAGKKHYNEGAFFQALTEVEMILFFSTFGPNIVECEYEPTTGKGKHNPEASCKFEDGSIVNIEVKTAGYMTGNYTVDKYMPLVLLTDEGRKLFEKKCKAFGVAHEFPRVGKVKDYLNSSSEKFHVPRADEYNILCINWSYSDVLLDGFREPAMILANEVNGIFNHKDMAEKCGINADIYEKISCIIVFQNSVEAIVSLDFRYLWAGYPRKGGVILNPFLFSSDEEKDKFYRRMQIGSNDFPIDFDVKLYFDTASGVSPVVANSLNEIIKANIL